MSPMSVFSRRSALAAAGAVGVSAAVAASAAAAPAATEPSPTKSAAHPERDPQRTDLVAEATLLATYDAAIAAHPSLEGKLAPMRADHAAHLHALAAMIRSAAPKPEGAGHWPTGAAALAALVAAEKSAAADRATACVAAARDRAPVLASISASEAVHVAVLTNDA